MSFKLMKTKKGKVIMGVVFSVYLALLIKVILFKYPMDMILTILKSDEISPLSVRIAKSNFIPLKTIFRFLFESHSVRISMKNILGNIVAFVPLGFLLSIVFNRLSKFKSIIFSSFILSLILEIIQLLTAIGDFDVDDVLLNVFGALCGYIFYRISARFISIQQLDITN